MGLIDEILHHAVEIYRRTVNPNVMADAMTALTAQLEPGPAGPGPRPLRRGVPAAGGLPRRAGRSEYLAGETEGHPNREIALEELLMLWLANVNPAFATFDELFDDASLSERTAYES
jgi:hypothetical protein